MVKVSERFVRKGLGAVKGRQVGLGQRTKRPRSNRGRVKLGIERARVHS